MLKERIQQDLVSVMKQGNKEEVTILRTLLSSVLNKEKEKRYGIAKIKPDLTERELENESKLTDEETLGVISGETKKIKEAIEDFGRGGREDLVEKETKELKILKRYLPAEWPEEEIRKKAAEVISDQDAKEIKDMGRVIAQIMAEAKGRADGGVVAKIVKELLQK